MFCLNIESFQNNEVTGNGIDCKRKLEVNFTQR